MRYLPCFEQRNCFGILGDVAGNICVWGMQGPQIPRAVYGGSFPVFLWWTVRWEEWTELREACVFLDCLSNFQHYFQISIPPASGEMDSVGHTAAGSSLNAEQRALFSSLFQHLKPAHDTQDIHVTFAVL